MMAGSVFGDLSSAGGYVGTASYLAKADISTNTNVFYVATPDSLGQVQRGDSDTGAPDGPHTVCISDTAGGTCGAARSFSKGTYKFSLFGYTAGEDYGSATTDFNHLGVRTQLSGTNIAVTGVKLNDGVALDAIGSKDVTKLTIELENEESVVIDFPLKYNYGDVTDYGNGETFIGSTKNVKIKVSKASATSIYIDYLFDLSDMRTENKYFAYDPPVTLQSGHDDHDHDHDDGDDEKENAASALSCGLVMVLTGITALFMP
jgi:hypothetical protein